MNRPLTRELAVLAAKLHLLKSQRHTLSDLSDIKELRYLEELFHETLELTNHDGSVPRDPLAAISSDWQRLSDWNEYVLKWLNAADEMEGDAQICHNNPSYETLVEIQYKLEQWPGTLQQAMEYSRSQINEDDWVENLPYTEIIQIATIMGWDDSLKTPKSKTDLKIVENNLGKNNFAGNCLPLVASRYAANEGSQLIERRLKSFESLLQRTASLLEDHAKHQSILTDVHSLTFSGQFQSARELFNQLSKVRFTDLIYTDSEIPLERLEEKVEKNVKTLSDAYEEVKQVNEKSQQFHIIPPFKLFFSFFKIKKSAGQTLQNSINWVSSDHSSEENQVILAWRNALIEVFNEFNNLTKARLLRSIYILLPAWTAIFFILGFFIIFAKSSPEDLHREAAALLKDGALSSERYARMRLLKKSANAGYAPAELLLGDIYANGQGVPKAPAEALKWYRKAADQGNPDAQRRLGVMYLNGEGVAKDDRVAVEWYRKAADQGNAKAQFNLGVMYQFGKGVAKDDRAAVEWYRKAADQGEAVAQSNLAWMYDNGEGVAEDDRTAAQWYRKAADQGFADAQTSLGLMYQNGEGVTKDDLAAAEWHRKAADQGNAGGQTNLGLMYFHGRGVSKDEKVAVSWFKKSADQGYAQAQFMLGLLYVSGQGVMPDRSEARKFLSLAAEQGYEEAKALLKNPFWQ